MMKIKYVVAIFLFTVNVQPAFAQTEVEPWGNIVSIRLDGQPILFESSLRVVGKDWKGIKATGRERQRPKYDRKGKQQVITTSIDSINFTETVEDIAKGTAKIKVQVADCAERNVEGVYFAITLPDASAEGTIQSGKSSAVSFRTVTHSAIDPSQTIQITTADQQLSFYFETPISAIVRSEKSKSGSATVLYFPIQTGSLSKNGSASLTFTLNASGKVDQQPVHLTLHTDTTGRAFAGLGGNFRLQNPKTDPQVIDYCLDNLRIAWGRVEMPWRYWQPDIFKDPITEAKAGRLDDRVKGAMEMAQRLYKKGMPVILSAWAPPAWAVVGEPKFNPGPDGVWGNPLDHNKDEEIYKSIADYITYLKEQYGVEISSFSFNESDLGINIRQTGEEHAKLIKELGTYFATRGLTTKLLLGDNSDATSFRFMEPALNDPATYPYIQAISFHSWRGWDKETLQQWADAATKIGKPLIVGEGSIDAAAWNYPAIFEEPVYAIDEINLYIRLLAICQPASILQWQLTADYSPLAGGGIFGNKEPLHPTQRFWNLKQLSSTPGGLLAMPIEADRPLISCAALGDNAKSKYAIHLVNRGASRQVLITGLPSAVTTFRIYVTGSTLQMKQEKPISVTGGQAHFVADANAYITLISE